MKNKKTYFFFLSVLTSFIVIACSKSDYIPNTNSYNYPKYSPTPVPTPLSANGWTSAQLSTEINSCVQGASSGESPNPEKLEIYQKACTCFYKKISDKYVYSYYVTNSNWIIDSFIDSGDYSTCFKEANG